MIRDHFDFQITRNYDNGVCIGITPIWIHKHYGDFPFHFHVLVDLGFWFMEIRIGRDT